MSLVEILTAGEWRSRAYLRYAVDRWRTVNECEVLTAAVDDPEVERFA